MSVERAPPTPTGKSKTRIPTRRRWRPRPRRRAFPARETDPRRGVRAGPRRAAAGRRRAHEPRDVLHDLGRARGAQAAGRGPRQEHRRQGRVSPDGRAGVTLRAHAGGPVALADPGTTLGTSTTGSSEAAMRPAWRRSAAGAKRGRRQASSSAERPNFVCGPVQVCWEKFARYFDVEIRQVPMDAGRYPDGRRAMLSGAATRTRSASSQRSGRRSRASTRTSPHRRGTRRLQAQTGLDIPIHVDGASGGFLAPFVAPELRGTSACRA